MTYVDVTAPLRAMLIPVMELISITGVFWIAIGYLDRGVYPWRNTVVLVWLLCVLWRFVLPLVRQRRRRFVVTETEIRLRADGLFTRSTIIPLQAVRGAGRHKDTVTLHTHSGPIHVPGVAKAKRIAETINQLSYS